jgi:hypothetical protein
VRRSARGPTRKYCSASCRHQAYEARRRRAIRTTELTRAWQNDVSRAIAGGSALAGLNEQIADSMRAGLDFSAILPKFELPPLTPNVALQLSQAAGAARLFEQPLAALTGLNELMGNSFRAGLDFSAILPKFELPPLTPNVALQLSQAAGAARLFEQPVSALAGLNEQIADSMRAALDFSALLPRVDEALARDIFRDVARVSQRLEAALPPEHWRPSDLSSVHTQGPELETAFHGVTSGADIEVGFLLLVCLAIVVTVRVELATLLLAMLTSIIETTVTSGRMLMAGYQRLAEELPDDRVVTWAFSLAYLLRWLRHRDGTADGHGRNRS